MVGVARDYCHRLGGDAWLRRHSRRGETSAKLGGAIGYLVRLAATPEVYADPSRALDPSAATVQVTSPRHGAWQWPTRDALDVCAPSSRSRSRHHLASFLRIACSSLVGICGSGYLMFNPSSVSSSTCEMISRALCLSSAGTQYHGACSVLVALRHCS